jgi:hypothetical protein
MRCDDIVDRLDAFWNAELPPEVRAHLDQCSSCAAYHRDVLLLHNGLHLWKEEQPPAPTLGFAQRVVRHLSKAEAPARVTDFFELVGRRFVLATLALVFFALLAFTVPSTGPLQALSAADIQGTSQEAALAYSDPIGSVGTQEIPDAAGNSIRMPVPTNEAK